eukprot:scaffold18552_cov148-Skeletonema_marinoi.AAC.1
MSQCVFFVLSHHLTIPEHPNQRCCSRGGKIKVPLFSTLDRMSTLSKDYYDGSGLSPLSCCCCDWFAVHKHTTGKITHGQGVEGAGCRLQVADCRE